MESVCEDPDVIQENIVVSFLSKPLLGSNWNRTFPWFTLNVLPLSTMCCGQQVKLGSPDYTNRDTEEAVQDFMKRIKCYESTYEPLDEVQDR